jgi:hypothetical protein
MGLLLHAIVHPADIQDRDGGILPKAREGLGEPQSQGARILAPCFNSSHAPKVM